MKKLVLALTVASSFAFANGVIIQNTTQFPILVQYTLCQGGSIFGASLCGSPIILKLDKQSSNYNNPIQSPNKNMNILAINSVTNVNTNKSEYFAGFQCNAYYLGGIITFSSIIDNPNIIECTGGSYRKG